MEIKQAQVTRIIEIESARHFNFRLNVIVPNVFWGIGLDYEADLVVLRPSGYAVEVEIKASAADLARDKKKRHNHEGMAFVPGRGRVPIFRELWFAVPETITDHKDIPERAGILSCWYDSDMRHGIKVIRRPKIKTDAVRWDDKMRMKLLHLGNMRVWKLKQNGL